MAQVPKHWKASSWEDKAREDPFFAVMTAEGMSGDLTPERRAAFLAKGQALYNDHLAPVLRKGDTLFEYGCGPGRILSAAQAAGMRVIGADISPTMIEHGRAFLGSGAELYVVDSAGDVPVANDSADVCFSYAVLQHIAKLSVYEKAVAEICRIAKPGGEIVLQLNCEDFASDPRGRTENFEDYSIHYSGTGEGVRRQHNNWSGVYIGYDRMVALLTMHGCALEGAPQPNPAKPRSVWLHARKS